MQYKFDEKRHLHFLDNKPLTGTSSVGNVLAKPLTWWASGLACQVFGWLNPRKHTDKEVNKAAAQGLVNIMEMSLDNYKKLLAKAYRAHQDYLKKSADKGTDLHAELEDYVKGVMGIRPKREYDPKIQPFIKWAEENVKEFLWSEAHCYDEELWIGGISDLGVELNSGKLAVIDFKSSKEAYLTQFMQVAGYAIQIENNGLWSKDGKNNKKVDKKFEALIIVPFGADLVEPKIVYNVEELKQGFKWAVGLYRLMKI